MIEKTQNRIKIKGYQDGLLIKADHQDWKSFQEEILSHISERENFFQGAKIALDAGNLCVHAAELGQLRDRLSYKGVILRAVLSSVGETKNTAEMLGLETSLEKTRSALKDNGSDKPGLGEPAIIIMRTLRSGMRIQSQKSVIVLGDVNPGAEIISGKSIVIWGRLRGSVYAGKGGSQESSVCALSLAPTMLRIDNIVAELPLKLKKSRPYIAKIEQGSIQLEPWNRGEK
jgi:septum site-determining protein MinC